MTQLQNLTNDQIISFLQEDRDILIPFYTTREKIDEVMGTQLTGDEWLRECENIQDVFGTHLQENLLDELSYQNERDEILFDEAFLNTSRPKTIYQEIVEQDEENSVNLTLSAMQLKVIYNILMDTPFDSAHNIAGETLKVLKENNFDRESEGLPF
jgi:hypothetical protein